MRSGDFLSRYDQAKTMSWEPPICGTAINGITPREIYEDSRAWSNTFSGLLYSRLSGAAMPSLTEYQEITDYYKNWVFHKLPKIHEHATELKYNPDFANEVDIEAFSEEMMKERAHASFHDNNVDFVDTWAHLIGYDFKSNRRLALSNAAFGLTMKGCTVGAIRDGFIRQGTEANYFDTHSAVGRNYLEFLLNEMDAGITLIEFARSQKGSLMILPAPSAFEMLAGPRKDTPQNANADYIVVNTDDESVIGVQVKAQVTDEIRDKYDQERLILLDTRVDLGNQAAKQTESHRSDKRVVGWAGLIAVEAMHRIPVKSSNIDHLRRTGQLGLRQYARRNMQGLSPQLSVASKRIGERILEKL